MSFVKENLSANEKVIYEAHLHWLVYLNSYSLAGIVTLIFIFTLGDTYNIPYYVSLFGAITFCIGIANGLIQKYTTEVVITNQKIIRKVGLIARNVDELSLDKIESINVSQSIVERILNTGTLEIKGIGIGIVSIYQIDDPLEFRKKTYKEKDK